MTRKIIHVTPELYIWQKYFLKKHLGCHAQSVFELEILLTNKLHEYEQQGVTRWVCNSGSLYKKIKKKLMQNISFWAFIWILIIENYRLSTFL